MLVVNGARHFPEAKVERRHKHRHKSSRQLPLLVKDSSTGYRFAATRPDRDLFREWNLGTITTEFRPTSHENSGSQNLRGHARENLELGSVTCLSGHPSRSSLNSTYTLHGWPSFRFPDGSLGLQPTRPEARSVTAGEGDSMTTNFGTELAKCQLDGTHQNPANSRKSRKSKWNNMLIFNGLRLASALPSRAT